MYDTDSLKLGEREAYELTQDRPNRWNKTEWQCHFAAKLERGKQRGTRSYRQREREVTYSEMRCNRCERLGKDPDFRNLYEAEVMMEEWPDYEDGGVNPSSKVA